MPRTIIQRLSLVSLLTAALYILAFPKFNLSMLAWVALVPLLWGLSREKDLRPRQAFLTGWGTGTLVHAGLMYWLIPTYLAAHQPLVLAVGCLLLLAGYLGLYWGVWSLFLFRARSLSPLIFCLFAATSWTALEYARTWLLSGFPWTLLADSQVAHLSLIQIASITGSYGVSFLMVLMNASLASLLSPNDSMDAPRRGLPLTVTLVLLLGLLTWGRKTLSAPDTTRQAPLQVALLQGSVDQYKKWDKAYVQEIEDRYQGLAQEAAALPVQLIIWPETSIPGYLLQDESLRQWLARVVRNSRTHNLVGAPHEIGNKAYNMTFSLTSKCELSGQYAKRHLVPFGEVVPFGAFLGKFINALNDLGGFTAGSDRPVVPAAGVRVGVNICYESIFPSLVRDSVRQGAQILVNQTNDGWYMKTAAPYQHWAPNLYRAVENRRYLLRANNTGISGIVDPWGRVVIQSPIFEPLVLRGTVYPREDSTLYTRFGDVFAILCVLLTALIWAWIDRRVILRLS